VEQSIMIASEHGVFRATLSVLPETASFIGNLCNLHGIGSTDALRLTLIGEELFTNAVGQGYGEKRDAPIHIGLFADIGAVGLLYEDAAPPHDPLSPLSGLATNLDGAVESPTDRSSLRRRKERPTLRVHAPCDLHEACRTAPAPGGRCARRGCYIMKGSLQDLQPCALSASGCKETEACASRW
jgi:hypothetical protein